MVKSVLAICAMQHTHYYKVERAKVLNLLK